MKRLILIVMIAGLCLPAMAQQSQQFFQSLTGKYADRDGFSASMLTSDMFDLYLRKKNVDESSEVFTALKQLDNILVVSQSKIGVDRYQQFFNDEKPAKKEKSETDELHKEMLRHYPADGYILLKTEKRMGEDVKVFLKKNNDKVSSLALVTNSSASTNLVELNGDIDLANVASLGKAINLRGLEALYKIDNSSSSYGYLPNAYYPMSDERIAELETRAREMAEKHAELSDEQLKKIEMQAQLQAEKHREMEEKRREMAEQYGRQAVFLSTPGDTNTVYIIDGKKVEAKEVKKLLKENEVKQLNKARDEKTGKTEIRIKTK